LLPEELSHLRAVMLANNETVMKEMQSERSTQSPSQIQAKKSDASKERFKRSHAFIARMFFFQWLENL